VRLAAALGWSRLPDLIGPRVRSPVVRCRGRGPGPLPRRSPGSIEARPRPLQRPARADRSRPLPCGRPAEIEVPAGAEARQRSPQLTLPWSRAGAAASRSPGEVEAALRRHRSPAAPCHGMALVAGIAAPRGDTPICLAERQDRDRTDVHN
jgi:hypothetical protein